MDGNDQSPGQIGSLEKFSVELSFRKSPNENELTFLRDAHLSGVSAVRYDQGRRLPCIGLPGLVSWGDWRWRSPNGAPQPDEQYCLAQMVLMRNRRNAKLPNIQS